MCALKKKPIERTGFPNEFVVYEAVAASVTEAASGLIAGPRPEAREGSKDPVKLGVGRLGAEAPP